MSCKNSYNTKQKKELTDYLKSVNGEHVTVNDICEHFKKMGIPIGMTTIYRHLERMTEEGCVNKYIIDSNSPACFEYISANAHGDDHTCFHCKCDKCGRLIHLHSKQLEDIKKHLEEDHSFYLNSFKTVFYGICKDCMASDSDPGL